jgi:hypothetical protein
MGRAAYLRYVRPLALQFNRRLLDRSDRITEQKENSLRSAVLRIMRWIVVRAGLRLASKLNVLGIIVIDLTGHARRSLLYPRIEAALALIKEHDPRRFLRTKADLRRIAITETQGPEYWPFASVCALSVVAVRDLASHVLAGVIVHEAVHARLFRCGISYDEGIRARVEQLCIEEQVSFLRKVPGAEDHVAHLEVLKHDAWYTDDQLRERLRRQRG